MPARRDILTPTDSEQASGRSRGEEILRSLQVPPGHPRLLGVSCGSALAEREGSAALDEVE